MQIDSKANEEPKGSYLAEILNYTKDNIVGLSLVLVCLVIIYAVDRIAMYNTAMAAMAVTMPVVPTIRLRPHKKKSSTKL